MLKISRLSGRLFCTAAVMRPLLFVGLGNPGDKYKGARHNVGFEMIDEFAESQGISMNMVHCKAIVGQGFVGDAPVLVAKPQTYMNLSGASTGPLAAYHKLPLNHVIVFHDDMGLPCGVLFLHHNRGHGGHNGLKSVVYKFLREPRICSTKDWYWETSWSNGYRSFLAVRSLMHRLGNEKFIEQKKVMDEGRR